MITNIDRLLWLGHNRVGEKSEGMQYSIRTRSDEHFQMWQEAYFTISK